MLLGYADDQPRKLYGMPQCNKRYSVHPEPQWENQSLDAHSGKTESHYVDGWRGEKELH